MGVEHQVVGGEKFLFRRAAGKDELGVGRNLSGFSTFSMKWEAPDGTTGTLAGVRVPQTDNKGDRIEVQVTETFFGTKYGVWSWRPWAVSATQVWAGSLVRMRVLSTYEMGKLM